MGCRRLGVVAAVLLGIVPVSAPSPAAAAGAGEQVFQCSATLDHFPSPYEVALCAGRGSLTAAGTTDTGLPFVVTGAGQYHAVFEYQAQCLMGQPSPVTTIAARTELGGLSGIVGGVPVTARLEASWTATVIGTDMNITVRLAHLEFSNGETARFTLQTGTGQGQFVAPPGSCPQGGPVNASAAGEIIFL